jgi:hypothetical protein
MRQKGFVAQGNFDFMKKHAKKKVKWREQVDADLRVKKLCRNLDRWLGFASILSFAYKP